MMQANWPLTDREVSPKSCSPSCAVADRDADGVLAAPVAVEGLAEALAEEGAEEPPPPQLTRAKIAATVSSTGSAASSDFLLV